MSVKAPEAGPPPKNTLRWVFSGVLCACTLVALWVTAARVKAAKLEARYGHRIEESVQVRGEIRSTSLRLRRGTPTPVEHFTVSFAGTLSVTDAKGRACVDFIEVAPGQVRRWQELQLTVVEADPEFLSLEVELHPGSPCFGAGDYRVLRQGLRIEFPGKRAVTIAAYDPAKPSMILKFEAGPEQIDQPLEAGLETKLLGIRAQLQRDFLRLSDK